jgi:hypothetical protein
MTSPDNIPPYDPSQPNGTPPEGRMRPTSIATLFSAALATAGLAWLAISLLYDKFEQLPWLPPLTLLGLALVEAVTASSTRARIERRKGTAPINPLLVARYVVLAKASALAGALFTGLYSGIFAWLLTERDGRQSIDRDLPLAVVGMLGSFALVIAALWLERACQVPPPTKPPTGTPPPSGEGDRSAGGRSAES